jgi:hypothetical protein
VRRSWLSSAAAHRERERGVGLGNDRWAQTRGVWGEVKPDEGGVTRPHVDTPMHVKQSGVGPT